MQKAILGVVTLLALSAQDTKPGCNGCSATYISHDEIPPAPEQRT